MNNAPPRHRLAHPARRLTVDRGSDLHTHSDLTDGTASPEQMADAAMLAGLHTWGLSDHVRADSTWVGDYATRVRSIWREDMTIRCGVEAKMLDAGGSLDLPPGLPALDYLLVADHQFPSAMGPLPPGEVRRHIEQGVITRTGVIDTLITASTRAIRRAPFPAVLVHPFSLLPKMGLSEDDVLGEHLRSLAGACVSADAAVEINEKWTCPSLRIVNALAAAGVRLVAGSDAHRCEDVGAWSYLDTVTPVATGRPRAVST